MHASCRKAAYPPRIHRDRAPLPHAFPPASVDATIAPATRRPLALLLSVIPAIAACGNTEDPTTPTPPAGASGSAGAGGNDGGSAPGGAADIAGAAGAATEPALECTAADDCALVSDCCGCRSVPQDAPAECDIDACDDADPCADFRSPGVAACIRGRCSIGASAFCGELPEGFCDAPEETMAQRRDACDARGRIMVCDADPPPCPEGLVRSWSGCWDACVAPLDCPQPSFPDCDVCPAGSVCRWDESYSCVDPLGCGPDSYCECIPEVCGSGPAPMLCFDGSDLAIPGAADVACRQCVDCN